MKVFVHLRTQGNKDWVNSTHNFGRLPVIGEYVQVERSTEWHVVQAVVHCPFAKDFQAEIYAVQVDHLEECKRLLV